MSSYSSFTHSIKFRLWNVFFGFTILILVILYASQVVLMPALYHFIKTQECISTANDIKYAWEIGDVKRVVDESARQKQMDILIHIPASVAGGRAFDYFQNSTGSSVSVGRRVSDEIVNALKESKSGMVFFPVLDDTKESFLLGTYIGKENEISCYIFIYSFLEPTGTTTKILSDIFMMTSGIIILLSLVFSIFISQMISKPIVRITNSANKLITGEFNLQTSERDYSEVKKLTENLNMASFEISRSDTLRKDLLANISHDLRTPLTMIKAYAEMIRDLSGNNPEKREKHLQVIIDETDRLSLLVNDILDLSKLQSGTVEMKKETFDLSTHIREIVSRFAMLDETKIILDVEDGIYISADARRLEQAVYNLIINAINYSGVDTVEVALKKEKGNKIRFSVSDKGVGISKEQLPYIWDRYYKVNRSENYKRVVKGTGLGLSIVKSVFECHGFEYGVESEEGNGTKFWFRCSAEKEVEVNAND